MSESSGVRLRRGRFGRHHPHRRRQGQCLHRRISCSLLSEALDLAVARDRAALILGSDRCLSAGFDLSVMRRDPEARKRLVLAGLEVALKIFESPIPVVVGCTGHAIAAGTLLLLGADHVVVGDGPVKIGFNETTIGIELSPVRPRARPIPAPPFRLQPDSARNALRRRSGQSAGYVDEVVTASRPRPSCIGVANQHGRSRPGQLSADEEGDAVEHGRERCARLSIASVRNEPRLPREASSAGGAGRAVGPRSIGAVALPACGHYRRTP